MRFRTEAEAQAAGYRRARNEMGVVADTPMLASPWRGAGRYLTLGRAGVGAQLARLAGHLGQEEQPHGRGMWVRLHELSQQEHRGLEW